MGDCWQATVLAFLIGNCQLVTNKSVEPDRSYPIMPLFECLSSLLATGIAHSLTTPTFISTDGQSTEHVRLNAHKPPRFVKRPASHAHASTSPNVKRHSPHGHLIPSANEPAPAYMQAACASGNKQACQSAVVRAINHNHAKEGIRAVHLPSNYNKLSVPQQLLTVSNQERKDRGLPTISHLSPALNAMAMRGAAANADPTGPQGKGWGSNWAGNEGSVLQADYDWMYNDGPGGDNIDCTRPGQAGCWGHRKNILGNYGAHPSMGAANTQVHGVPSMTELFAS